MSDRKHSNFTPEAVLEWMQPGREYGTQEISDAFGVKRQYVWDILKIMHKHGDIERVSNEWRQIKFAKAKRLEPLRTSVAGPAYAPDLRSTMAGYEAAMRQRVELAMCVRRAA